MSGPANGHSEPDYISRVNRVGIFVNLEKAAACEAVGRFREWLLARKLDVILLEDQSRTLEIDKGVTPKEFYTTPELIVSLGGDGTFLHVARQIRQVPPALLGVNFGRLGYLTAVDALELVPFCERILARGVPVENRLRLAAQISEWASPPPALNDVVIQDAEGVRVISVRIKLGDRVIGEFRADGIIVATPTGSTAYTLSVGGPVVHPRVEGILMAMISPHTLQARPMVVSARDVVTIEVLGDKPVRVVVDGQASRTVKPGAPITIGRAAEDVAVVVDPLRPFVDRLRTKLRWGGLNPV